MNIKNKAKKNIYDMAVEKHGKATTIDSMKKAFGNHKTNAVKKAIQSVDRRQDKIHKNYEEHRERMSRINREDRN